LREQVQTICQERGWQFEEVDGDLHLLQRWSMASGSESVLTVPPGQKVMPSYDGTIMSAEPVTP